jgi:uncharacterized protein (TIGR02118 family)
MIKVSVMYPSGDDSTFDMDYYRANHVEIVNRVLKPSRFDIDKGIDGQPYMVVAHLWFDSTEAMQAGMGSPDAAGVMADVPNFTNARPQIQISEVVQ